ncbi:MAG TPA: DNA mismatch repair endonuclease MutL [Kiritimatiellia bacterium]|nr:DNA mismatch repair endonuclease MutL [Kiritimatiellia bacterium]HRZ12186.1 DNA mismatch repair endonuclease MutL [Kiritimatiellia bacterium]HSA18056.1 DNA mismatch repair endonuclease MutL [Kiritimatiellia bacterium]
MPGPAHIRLLSDEVINKIAAGEVVDRPASVLKELLENALDAGATRVTVEIVAGGRKMIAVSDDGGGMDRDDALLSIERHATSKIRDVDDIEDVATLGFRGEALAAIAAVSQFTLTTRTAAAEGGTEITVAGGKIRDVRDEGCPAGTRVQVRNLFFNVPARRKFLRSEQTELSHVRQVFLLYALSHPAVGLALRVDEREVWRLAAGATLNDRLLELFGPGTISQLRPVDFRAGELWLHGYAGIPSLSRGDRSDQYFFINGRPAGAPLLHFALSEAYHTLLPRGRYPVLYLFLELPPGQVDVNVHPAKKEVRFRNTGAVRDAVIEGLRRALGTTPAAPEAAPIHPLASVAPPAEAWLPAIRRDQPPAFAYPRLPMAPAEGEAPAPGPSGSPAAAPAAGPWAWCRVLGQVGGLYVVMETPDGVVLMDPHAAHERVLFERFMKEVTAHRVNSQGLLAPETVALLPQDARRVREQLDLLRDMGFGLSEFGADTFLVDALPVCLGNVSAAALLAEVADTLERAGARGGTERWAEEAVAQASCKAAVKARDQLAPEEIEELVRALAATGMPYTCPHGRPTVIFMSFGELHRKFGRA